MKGLVVLGALSVVSIFVLGFVAIGQEVSAGPGLELPSLRSAIAEAPGSLREALSHNPVMGFAIGTAFAVAALLVRRAERR